MYMKEGVILYACHFYNDLNPPHNHSSSMHAFAAEAVDLVYRFFSLSACHMTSNQSEASETVH